MATKLFVAGLDFGMTENELSAVFAEFGTINSLQIITDKYTQRSKGFGFVEMSTDEEAKNAIATLNGKELNGRQLAVNEARPREDRPARPAYGGGRSDSRGSMGNNFRRSNR